MSNYNHNSTNSIEATGLDVETYEYFSNSITKEMTDESNITQIMEQSLKKVNGFYKDKNNKTKALLLFGIALGQAKK
jgi:hypothetical protein